MTNRFRVELRGDKPAMQAVAPRLQAPELRLQFDDGRIFLVSSVFEAMASRDAVFGAAQGMLPALTAAIRLAGIARLNDISAVRVEEGTPDGAQSTTYVQAQAAALIVSMPTPTILIGGKPPPPPPAIHAELALVDSAVARALELFSREPSWADLFKVLEVVEEDVGGEKALERTVWASPAELKRFTATANNLNAVGLDARHARTTHQAPKSPMTLKDAERLIGQVVEAWLASKK